MTKPKVLLPLPLGPHQRVRFAAFDFEIHASKNGFVADGNVEINNFQYV